MNETFVALFLKNQVAEEDIDLYIETWAQLDSDINLSEYLGMTNKQYGEWVFNPNRSLKEILRNETSSGLSIS